MEFVGSFSMGLKCMDSLERVTFDFRTNFCGVAVYVTFYFHTLNKRDIPFPIPEFPRHELQPYLFDMELERCRSNHINRHAQKKETQRRPPHMPTKFAAMQPPGNPRSGCNTTCTMLTFPHRHTEHKGA